MLMPERFPLTDEQRAANRVAPFGPITTALYGTQDVAGFFARAARSLTDGDLDILAELAADSIPNDDEQIYPDGACCMAEADEFPRGHVSVWAETALGDDPEGGF